MRRGRPPKQEISTLDNLISQLLGLWFKPGGINLDAATEDGLKYCDEHPDLMRLAAGKAIYALLKRRAMRWDRQLFETDAAEAEALVARHAHGIVSPRQKPQQLSFWGDLLEPAYPLIADGQRIVRPRRALTREEWRSLIAIRQDSVAADNQRIEAMIAADRALSPIWDAHPDWLMGEVEDEYARQNPPLDTPPPPRPPSRREDDDDGEEIDP